MTIDLKALALEVQKLDSPSEITIALAPELILQFENAVLESAATIAESYEPRCDTCPRGVANAIRALKTKEPT